MILKVSFMILLRNAMALMGAEKVCSTYPVDILINDGHIESIIPSGTHCLLPDNVVDLSNHLVLPGLVNGHQHSHEHYQRGRAENLPLELWMHLVRTQIPVELSPRQIYLRTMIGAIESLRTGCTTLVDDMAIGPVINRENIEMALQAYEDVGIRAIVGFSMMDKPIVDSFPFVAELFPSNLTIKMRSAIQPTAKDYLNLVRSVARYHHPQNNRIGVIVSVSAPQRCTENFLRNSRKLADELSLPMITHVQETRMQVVTGNEFYGGSMINYLDSIGFLKPKTSLIHAVWINPREIDILSKSGTTAQHNPWSNLMLGSGVQPVRELLDAGVNVSLGSDGSCSTTTVNMLNVVGITAAISKLRGDDPTRWISAREALHAGTLAGGRALGFGDSLGSLHVGAIADIIAFRTDTITFTPFNDPVRQLVYAERGAALDFAMVEGNIVMKDGNLIGIDEPSILAEIKNEFLSLKDKYGDAEASVAPILSAVEAIYRRSLASPISSDTYIARIASPKNNKL